MNMSSNIVTCAVLTAVLIFSHSVSEARAAAASDKGRIEIEIMKVLDDFMSAINRRDTAGREATFHFPHYRLATGKMTVLDRPGLPESTKKSGEQANRVVWDHRRIIHISEDKAHVDTMFSRYRADGSKLSSAESLYILTKENGRWGIKMRSSFAE